MTKNKLEHLSPEELKDLSLEQLKLLKSQFQEFSDELSDLIFYIKNDNLGNNQAFVLSISGNSLSVKRDEGNLGEMYKRIIEFCSELVQEDSDITQERKTIGDLIHLVSQNPLVKKENLRFRDITVILIALKHMFPDEADFVGGISELRKHIHKKQLGKIDFSLKLGDIELNIPENTGDGEILKELFHFAHKIYGEHPGKFQEYLGRSQKIKTDEPKDRREIWSIILGTLTLFKQTFKNSNFGSQIAELKDTIQSYSLLKNDYNLESPWGDTLEILKDDDLDTVVEKLIVFLGNTQEKNASRFEKHTMIRSQEIIAQKEKEKTYWRDIITGIEFVQEYKYDSKEFPQLQQFREMIEEGELGKVGSLISLNVDAIPLYITKFDTEKTIKNKVLKFIGELKYKASQGETMDAQKVFWRDILLQLKGMEEVYGDYSDYQLLMMTIEEGTLGTVKDFMTVIDGILLEIFPIDTDRRIREKLTEFIKKLKEHKSAKVDEKAMKRMKTRLEETERDQEELRVKYEKLIREQEELKRKSGKQQRDQQEKIKELEDEVEMSKRVQSATPSRFG